MLKENRKKLKRVTRLSYLLTAFVLILVFSKNFIRLDVDKYVRFMWPIGFFLGYIAVYLTRILRSEGGEENPPTVQEKAMNIFNH